MAARPAFTNADPGLEDLPPEIILFLNTQLTNRLNAAAVVVPHTRLAFAYDAIKARDARNKISTWLPPLYGYNIEKGPQLQASGYRGRTDSRGQGRGTGFRPRLPSSFPQGQGHNNNNNFRSNNQQAQVNQSFGNYQPRFQSQQQMPTPQTSNIHMGILNSKIK
ncbi:unnamed protein product [Orchesella dallaii]|uniref:Uncharacterized protein n=1 Tax=Orchesella dallaii TaxID=48710 RepID=A0ABP1R428_9HEXA